MQAQLYQEARLAGNLTECWVEREPGQPAWPAKECSAGPIKKKAHK